jgi:ATP synthase subunit 6
MLYTYYSPLEQFTTIQVLSSFLSILDISNIFITFTVIISILIFSIYFNLNSNFKTLYLIPSLIQNFLEKLLITTFSVVEENIQADEKKKFLPLVTTIFIFFLFLNLFGTMPYTFTITSQIFVTFTISAFIFIGIQIINIRHNKFKFFSSFFPSGVSVLLSFLIVPIEFISFFFKPISLGIRLFANMMAGHTLLKICASFVWFVMGFGGLVSFSHILALFGLIILLFLEVGVAAIQAFVFTVLICTYLNDIFNLH